MDVEAWAASRLGQVQAGSGPSQRLPRADARNAMGERLRTWMRSEQLEASEVAGQLEVSVSRLRSLCAGSAAWQELEFELAAELLGVSADSLLQEVQARVDERARARRSIPSAAPAALAERANGPAERAERRKRARQRARFVELGRQLPESDWQSGLAELLASRAATTDVLREVVLEAAELLSGDGPVFEDAADLMAASSFPVWPASPARQ